MNHEKTPLERGYDALKAMVAEGTKVNMNSVSTRANFSHTNFRYAEIGDLKDAIEAAKKHQEATKLSNEVEVLKSQISDLTAKLKIARKQVKQLSDNKAQKPIELIIKLTEYYRLNDQLRSENIDLKNQLAHKLGVTEKVFSVNSDTGEIIGIFDR